MNPYKARKAFYRMDIANNEILRHHILLFDILLQIILLYISNKIVRKLINKASYIR